MRSADPLLFVMLEPFWQYAITTPPSREQQSLGGGRGIWNIVRRNRLLVPQMRLIAIVVTALFLTTAQASAEPFWMMDWSRQSPEQGCRAWSRDLIAQAEAYMRKNFADEVAFERQDMVDGRVDVVRFTAVGDPVGGRMTSVYVSDLGYCLATFYDYRTDDMLFRAGKPMNN